MQKMLKYLEDIELFCIFATKYMAKCHYYDVKQKVELWHNRQ